jgi:Arc/MetJ-type ribon-helix-helix transcriptional regulator
MAYQFPPDLDQLLKERMASGGYTSEDDVLRDALRALEELTYFRPHPHKGRLTFEELRIEVRRGLDELDRGEGQDADEVFDELLRDMPDPNKS